MISLAGVSRHYVSQAGTFRALHEVDLQVAAGELLAVVGRSGSGKSTLLGILGGLDRPSGGLVRVANADLGGMSEADLSRWRGRKVGFVFQFFHLLPALTAVENVTLPMDFARSRPGRERRPRALELLAQLGVLDQADKLPASLSGGQQQRVALARALANDPEVLLADEPTGNLDSQSAREVFELFRGLKATVVVATHDRSIRADRVVELADGKVV